MCSGAVLALWVSASVFNDLGCDHDLYTLQMNKNSHGQANKFGLLIVRYRGKPHYYRPWR